MIWTLSGPSSPVPGAELTQPPEERSTNGLLQIRLEAAAVKLNLAGRQVSALGYNGSIPGPTLRLRAGDTLRIMLVNNLPQPTNIHVHGLHVSPAGNGDNVFIAVAPGTSHDYEYKIADDHPPGMYWYHPHHHGLVADQIFGGLYGAIIIEDPSPIEAPTERVLVISDTSLDGLGNIQPVSAMERMMGREGQLILVNGQSNPQFTTRPGQRERWRILNACVARYLSLRLDGQELQILGIDSGRNPAPETADELLLLPGNRADVLVTTRAGESVLRAPYYSRGSMPGMMGAAPIAPNTGIQHDNFALATLRVSGEPNTPPPGSLPPQQPLKDLSSSPIAARRQIALAVAMGMGSAGMMSFTINGKEFNEARTDTTVAIGSVEEWTLTNSSPMDHPFHLHVWPMQIIEENGKAAPNTTWRDVVNVPANGQVKVKIAFNNFPGRSAYHCHILDHEDLGMMGAIEAR